MPKRNYKELWEQLKTILECGPKKRYPNTAILQTMTNLELKQLGQKTTPVDIPKSSKV